jgi:limonene 1,2-monooxygenase
MRMRFGVFLAPHHPLGEHPTLQLHRDLDLVEQLDRLGFDEFWCGEHHSGGWETIASPEMFLAAASQRTSRIRLGTGVVSLPYHHPFNVADRIVLLDHLTRGRAMLGVGPGALPSDAVMLGIDPAVQRDRMDEATGVILRLLRGETVTHVSDWFELRDARLQLPSVQEEIPVVSASSLSPAGMKVAGKYGIGVISVASYTEEGLAALPTQWGFGETYAREHGNVLDRDKWRILMQWHLAPTREQAIAEVADGLKLWHNGYNVTVLGRPGVQPVDDGAAFARNMMRTGGTVFGTPDDAVAAVERLVERSGGFGTLLGFAHDWASPEATRRSYDLFARYVIPRLQGLLARQEASAAAVGAAKEQLSEQASQAILAAIRQHNATHPREQGDEGRATQHDHFAPRSAES